MNADANKAIVQRYVEMWNTGNTALAESTLGPDYRDHAHPEVSGPEGVIKLLAQVRGAAPDFNITIDSIISEGDQVALRITIRMTQQGKAVESHVMWFVRIADGKMIELWTGSVRQ